MPGNEDNDRFEDDEDRPGRKRRDDDDSDDDRPRKRRYDDEDDNDEPPPRRPRLSGLDAMFVNTGLESLIIFGCCCGWIAVILSVVALATCTDERARRNAIIVLIIAGCVGAIQFALGVVAGIAEVMK